MDNDIEMEQIKKMISELEKKIDGFWNQATTTEVKGRRKNGDLILGKTTVMKQE